MPQRRRVLFPWFVFLLIALSLTSILFAKEPKLVLLITVDTLRSDHLSCYGYAKPTSPNIDLFAKDSLRFENCLAHAPETTPSLASLLTGLYPQEAGTPRNAAILSTDVVTMAQIFKSHGYKTQAIVANFVIRKTSNFGQGFEGYDDSTTSNYNPHNHRYIKSAGVMTQLAINYLRQHQAKEENLFLWLHYMEPHGPYLPPTPYNRQFLSVPKRINHLKFNPSNSGIGGIPAYQRLGNRTGQHYYISQYDGLIAYLDSELGLLMNELKNLKLYDSSLIILTADHGEQLGEHNLYFCHGESFYQEVLRVPLIIKGTGRKGTVKKTAQLIDILPTILAFLEIKNPVSVEGRNILSPFPDQPIYSSFITGDTLTWQNWNLHVTSKKNVVQLFNLQEDPWQMKNLSRDPAHRKRLDTMIKLINERRERVKSRKIAPQIIRPSQDEIEKLRSLGY